MIDVLRYRYLTAIFSALIIVSFCSYFFYRLYTHGSAFSYNIDFTGGAEVMFKTSEELPLNDLRTLLEKKGWQGVSVRSFSSHDVIVRVKDFNQNATVLAQAMKQHIHEAYPTTNIDVLQSETVSAGIGSVLRLRSLYAIILALLIMMGYIAFRFWSFAFAMGAIVALFHDALVVLGFFLFLGRDISWNLIGAITTMLGYSINDTIVIFSRIRDNLRTMHNHSLNSVVTLSINQTLRRSILTSVATALSVLAMFLFGGEALRDLSLALLVGIIFGTYSSIYIASPVMMLFYNKVR